MSACLLSRDSLGQHVVERMVFKVLTIYTDQTRHDCVQLNAMLQVCESMDNQKSKKKSRITWEGFMKRHKPKL